MRTIELKIPDNVDLKDSELVLMLAAKLYQDAKLTAGQAAEMVGLSKKAFIEVLGSFNVSVFSESVEDLKHDLENA
jgi:predicted HTH domain antitoxin